MPERHHIVVICHIRPAQQTRHYSYQSATYFLRQSLSHSVFFSLHITQKSAVI